MIMTRSTVEAPVRNRALTGASVWRWGVLLPLAAIAVEAATAMCVDFIDPMPMLSYLALLLGVPVCNAIAWRGLERDALDHSRWFAAMTGFSAVIAFFYTVLFARLLPFALIGLIVLLPILAFAPILSLWTAIRLMRAWADLAGRTPIVWGAACGAATLIVLALPAIGVRVGAGMVQSERAWLRDAGYGILHSDGTRQELLESCEPSKGTDARHAVALITGRGALDMQEARTLYYRATGQAYDQQPVSRWRRRA